MNHPKLYNEVVQVFAADDTKFLTTDTAETHDKGHGRIEERKCRIIRDINEISNFEQWVSLKSIIEVKRKVTEKK